MLNNRYAYFLLLSWLVVLALYLPGCSGDPPSAYSSEDSEENLSKEEEAELMDQEQFDLKYEIPPLDQAIPSDLKTATLAMG
ncbi:MAG: hypothetical protein R6U91_00395 [Bacillota bacterium]